jgi:dTDP-4-amino-4,6-dideoxygalactose transaminase
MSWKVPFFNVELGPEESEAVQQVLLSNWLTAGPIIHEFEEQFSRMLGGDVYAVAVSSATAALHLSLLALNIKPGDEVIVPTQTFVACANVIRYVGATPIFVDIISETNWNICALDLQKKISPKTKAIMPVHFAGYACDMKEIMEIAKSYNLKVIEDCSHGPLSMSDGKNIGTFGDTGCFSFFSNKNMTTGEGGMVVTNNEDVKEHIKILRSHGISSSTYQRFKGHAFGYDVLDLGYNYRLDEIRAAIGIVQLQKLPMNNKKRKSKVEYYSKLLSAKIPSITIPFDNWNDLSSYHIFPVLLPRGSTNRDEVMEKMKDQGIQCSIHYRPVHTFSAYKDFKADVPKIDSISDLILTLPLFPNMLTSQIDLVVEKLKNSL